MLLDSQVVLGNASDQKGSSHSKIIVFHLHFFHGCRFDLLQYLLPCVKSMLCSIQIFLTAAFFSRCPFLLNLDLIGIANRFDQFNLPAFALGTLLLIPSAQRKAQQIHVSVHVNATPEKKPLQKSSFMFVLLYRLYHRHDLCLWD